MLKENLEANLRKYQLFILLQKRAFLPVIGIYLVSIGKLSLLDISTIASITVAVRLVLEVPTGYFADRFGRKWSVVVGSFIACFSPLAFIVFPNYLGGLLASLFYFGGFSFISGAHNAFIHDTMQALGRVEEYSKFRGRAQSYSLVGNMIIIALVPMSYSIDPRLPFIFGFIFILSAFLLALTYSEPPVLSEEESIAPGIMNMLKTIPKTELLILFSIYGIISSVFDNAPQFREILYTNLGVPVAYLGVLLALGSLLAAAMGHVIHRLADLPHRVFYFVDIFILVVALLAIGISQNPYLAIAGFLLMNMYDRNRAIVAESHILSRYPAKENKATLLSMLAFSSSLQGLWIALALGSSLHFFGISKGFVYFGLTMGVLLVLLMFLYLALEKRKTRIA